jgi:hypothetical protein
VQLNTASFSLSLFFVYHFEVEQERAQQPGTAAQLQREGQSDRPARRW